MDGDGRADLLVAATRRLLPAELPRPLERARASCATPTRRLRLRRPRACAWSTSTATASSTRCAPGAAASSCFFNDPDDGWAGARAASRGGDRRVPRRQLRRPARQARRHDRRRPAGHRPRPRRPRRLLAVPRPRPLGPPDHDGRAARCSGRRALPATATIRERVLLGDVDGDGLADLVYVDAGRVTVWINQGGNGWSDPIVIDGTPPCHRPRRRAPRRPARHRRRRACSGRADAAPARRATTSSSTSPAASSRTCSTQIDNHLGARHDASSTRRRPRSTCADQRDPATRWRTPLPFPVQVVARVEVDRRDLRRQADHRVPLPPRLLGRRRARVPRLRPGRAARHRDVRRFHAPGCTAARVRARDPTHFSPPTLTRTWFHQGPVGDEFGDWTRARPRRASTGPATRRRSRATGDTGDSFLRRAARRRAGATRCARCAAACCAPSSTRWTARAAQDRPYTVTETPYGVREEDAARRRRRAPAAIFFPHALGQRTTQWERGDDPMTAVRLHRRATTRTASRAGSSRSPCRAAATPRVPRRRRRAVPGDARDDRLRAPRRRATATSSTGSPRTTSYEIVERRHARARCATLSSASRAGSRRRRALHRPDAAPTTTAPAFVGLPLGQLGEFGAAGAHARRSCSPTSSCDDAVRPTRAMPTRARRTSSPARRRDWTGEYPQAFRDLLPAAGRLRASPTDRITGSRRLLRAAARVALRLPRRPAAGARACRVATRDPLGDETAIDYDALRPAARRRSPIPRARSPSGRLRLPRAAAARGHRPQRQPHGASPSRRSGFVDRHGGDGQGRRASATRRAARASGWSTTCSRSPSAASRSRCAPIARVAPRHRRRRAAAERERDDRDGRVLRRLRPAAPDARPGRGRRCSATRRSAAACLPPDQSRAGRRRRRPAGERPATARTSSSAAGRSTTTRAGWSRSTSRSSPPAGTTPRPATRSSARRRTMFYDPRGQVVRTVNPDGSEQRVVFGVPARPRRSRTRSSRRPGRPTPTTPTTTPAAPTPARAAALPRTTGTRRRASWSTRSAAPCVAVARATAPTRRRLARRTRSTYDIRGNLLAVTDALGPRGVPLRLRPGQPRAGASRASTPGARDIGARRRRATPIERRDGKGALTLQRLRRAATARSGSGRATTPTAPVTLRERLEYGDGGTPDQPAAERGGHARTQPARPAPPPLRRGRPASRSALRLQGQRRSRSARQVIADAPILAVFAARRRTAGRSRRSGSTGSRAAARRSPSATPRCSTRPATRPRPATTRSNRVTRMQLPAGRRGPAPRAAARVQPRPARLEQVRLDDDRVRRAHRLRRQGPAHARRLRQRRDDPLRLRPADVPAGAAAQRALHASRRSADLPAGRRAAPGLRLRLRPGRQHRSPSATARRAAASPTTRTRSAARPDLRPLLASGDALDRRFDYDPLYRLRLRHRPRVRRAARRPAVGRPRRAAPTSRARRAYTERYAYDAAGNLLRLRTATAQAASPARSPRRPAATACADVHGRRRRRTTTRTTPTATWLARRRSATSSGTTADRLRRSAPRPTGAEPSVHAQYLYDAAGQRVKKLVRKQGGARRGRPTTSTASSSTTAGRAGAAGENNTSHVMDDQQRIALRARRARAPGRRRPGDAVPPGRPPRQQQRGRRRPAR